VPDYVVLYPRILYRIYIIHCHTEGCACYCARLRGLHLKPPGLLSEGVVLPIHKL
jgi:hypothetical protein